MSTNTYSRLLISAALLALVSVFSLPSALAATNSAGAAKSTAVVTKKAKKTKVAGKARRQLGKQTAKKALKIGAKKQKRTSKLAKAKQVTRWAKAKSRKGNRPLAGASSRIKVSSAGNGRNARINWNASAGCLPGSVKNALYAVAAKYGAITVNSTGRSRTHNRRVGGAPKSMHLQCRAADFRVHGGGSGVLSFLRKLPGLGGIKRYISGYYHIDNGPRRTWKG